MDPIYLRFLESSERAAKALSSASDVLTLVPVPPLPSATYIAEFRVPHLRRSPSGGVAIARRTVVGRVHFPADYLRSVDANLPMKVVSILSPQNFVHPNVAFGAVCLGYRFAPGTRLELLLYELYDIVSYRSYTLDESNAMNPEACRLLRAHPDLLEQLDPEPLIRRQHRIELRS